MRYLLFDDNTLYRLPFSLSEPSKLFLAIENEKTHLAAKLVHNLWFSIPMTCFEESDGKVYQAKAVMHRIHIVGKTFSKMLSLSPYQDMSACYELHLEAMEILSSLPSLPIQESKKSAYKECHLSSLLV